MLSCFEKAKYVNTCIHTYIYIYSWACAHLHMRFCVRFTHVSFVCSLARLFVRLLTLFLLVCSFVGLVACSFVRAFVGLFVCLFVCLVCLFFRLFARQPACLSVCKPRPAWNPSPEALSPKPKNLYPKVVKKNTQSSTDPSNPWPLAYQTWQDAVAASPSTTHCWDEEALVFQI